MQQQVLYKGNFFNFCQILFNLAHMFAVHHEKSNVSLFLRSLLITYLITSSLEKEIIVGEKIWKSLEFWIQKCV